MKKRYFSPRTRYIQLETESLIALSLQDIEVNPEDALTQHQEADFEHSIWD